MKAEDFIKLGLDEETAVKAAEAVAEEVKEYIPKTRFKEVVDEKNALKTALGERDEQLEALKNSKGDVEQMRTQIDDLMKDNKKKDEEHAQEIRQLKVDTAVESAILGAKGKNIKAIKALLDMEKISIDESGSIVGLEEQVSFLLRDEASSFLFEKEGSEKPVKGVKPIESTKDVPKVDRASMTYSELVELMANGNENIVEQ